jgi:NAD(P)-dependent dehydrogenase (short-subunit alcohol dehydrogenase family)
VKVNLDGTVTLITGAARGIGRAIAESFVQNGATVIHTDIDADELQRTASQHGGEPIVMDVTDEAQVAATFGRVLEKYARVDIVVNNAGVNTHQHRVTIDEFPKDEWERILNVDLSGLFLVSQAAARCMKLQQSGRILISRPSRVLSLYDYSARLSRPKLPSRT